MKKNYKGLEFEVVRFDEEDIITASGGDTPCKRDGLTPACPPDEMICRSLECPELISPCRCVGVEK